MSESTAGSSSWAPLDPGSGGASGDGSGAGGRPLPPSAGQWPVAAGGGSVSAGGPVPAGAPGPVPAGRPFSAAAQQPQPWPWPWPVPSPGPGWPQYTLAAPRTPPMRMPSGLFPSGPPRPIFREPFAVRGGSVALGVASGALWIILFGALASNARTFAWSTLAAAVIAWLVALLLARVGDRGAAVGVAVSAAVGLSITTIVVIVRWAGGDWPLW